MVVNKYVPLTGEEVMFLKNLKDKIAEKTTSEKERERADIQISHFIKVDRKDFFSHSLDYWVTVLSK